MEYLKGFFGTIQEGIILVSFSILMVINIIFVCPAMCICGIIASAGSTSIQQNLGLASIIISGSVLGISLVILYLVINGAIIADLIISFNGVKDCKRNKTQILGIGNYLRNIIFVTCISFFICLATMSFLALGIILYVSPSLNQQVGPAMISISGVVFLPCCCLMLWIITVVVTNLVLKVVDKN